MRTMWTPARPLESTKDNLTPVEVEPEENALFSVILRVILYWSMKAQTASRASMLPHVWGSNGGFMTKTYTCEDCGRELTNVRTNPKSQNMEADCDHCKVTWLVRVYIHGGVTIQ